MNVASVGKGENLTTVNPTSKGGVTMTGTNVVKRVFCSCQSYPNLYDRCCISPIVTLKVPVSTWIRRK